MTGPRLAAVLLAGLLLMGLLVPLWEPLQVVAGATTGTPAAPLPATSYDLSQQAPFNRPAFYPLDRRPDPALYRPRADWFGRLILPTPAEMVSRAASADSSDWVWFEVEHSPDPGADQVGQRLVLTWQDNPLLRSLVRTVSTDVELGEAARRARAEHNVVPERLDGRRGVGPLQSLAGARPADDVVVRLDDVLQAEDRVLRIGRPPIQMTGRWMALVRILSTDPTDGERFVVRHYDPASGGFDGPIETVRLPAQPTDRFGRRMFDPAGIVDAEAGADGWYLYGAQDASGLFTVQSLEPRALTRLQADRSARGRQAGIRGFVRYTWADMARGRGGIERLSLDATRNGRPWRVGDRGLLIHSFGGIGGVDGEPTPGFTVTGHFAYGEARVIADPFTGEPRFSLLYHQIYANNPNGIVSGTQDWSAYGGDLQRGWLGLRPIADVLIRMPEDLPLLRELAVQSEVLMARYRSGDGAGVATVTPATSCVQDSTQALFIAVDQLRRRGLGMELSGAARRQLESLDRSLDALMTPFGIARSDWRRNATVLAGVSEGVDPLTTGDPFVAGQGLMDVLLSWRSMLPRRAQDDVVKVFLRHSASVWILRTNQIPGADERLEPLAPTLLLGRIPLLSTLLRRLTDSLLTPPRLGLTLLLLGIYAAVALPVGLRSRFLRGRWRWRRPWLVLRSAAALLVMPALVEELLFRVALLPQPLEGIGIAGGLAWGSLSVGLFVLYHPLAARCWYPQAATLFHDPRFLGQCVVLGVTCVVAYGLTGSLWSPVLIHWLAVLVWLEPLGGRQELQR